MKKTHWKKLYNPDYLGSYSLNPGEDMVVTIKSLNSEIVTGADGKKEECMVLRFTDADKPMILNATNAKMITKIHKTPYKEEWVGKRIQLYAKDVKAFGEVVEALRIRPFVPKDAPKQGEKLTCGDCGCEIVGNDKLTALQVAQGTTQKYGEMLCIECGAKRKDVGKAVNVFENETKKAD